MPAKKGKKKQISNPARGFATVSTASKTKVEPESAEENKPSQDGVSPVLPLPQAQSGIGEKKLASTDQELHQLSPDELEKQLEQSELQLLLERHNAKIKKDSTRQITRLQTDRRVLRPQSSNLTTKDLLPEPYVTQILSVFRQDMSFRQKPYDSKDTFKPSHVENLTARLWTLQTVLESIAFPHDQVLDCLKWVLNSSSQEDADVQSWGLQEALDWFALNCDSDDLLSYDRQKIVNGTSQPNSRPDTPANDSSVMSTTTENRREPNALDHNSEQSDHDADPASDDLGEDFEVSDLDSDIEPDQMVLKYVSTKLRLLEFEDQRTSKGSARSSVRGLKRSVGNSKSLSKLIAKLHTKLQKIEADVLFDRHEAQAQWAEARNRSAKESAARRRLHLSDNDSSKPSKRKTDEARVNDREKAGHIAAAEVTTSGDDEASDIEVGDFLGSVFEPRDQEGEHTANNNAENMEDSTNVVVRDLGEISGGLSPRRVLEEACRTRDANVKISYRQISATSSASRHALEIVWSKEQDTICSPLPFVSCSSGQRSMRFAMTELSTANAQQSEAFIATAALFIIFGSSPKEEKAYLRLPNQLRTVWAEFVEMKKEQVEASDRRNLQQLRKLVYEQIERDEAEDIVMVESFKKRADMSEARSEHKPDESFTEPRGSVAGDLIKAQWLRKTSMPSYQNMLQTRMQLPIFNFRDKILSAVQSNQIVILCGETGCGKSTQLPSFILESELSQGRSCKIYCTEPRRISAISLAQRVSEELGERPFELGTSGSLVGYAIRLESRMSSQTKLVYATVGIVLRMLESHRDLDGITHLVIDEVHERSIDTDFLLVVVRSLLLRRPELKVVLMSATVDAQRFSNYLHGTPILTVPGRTFPVQTKFLEDAIELTRYTDSNSYDSNDVDSDDMIENTAEHGQVATTGLPSYSRSRQNTLSSFNEYRIDYHLIVSLIEKIAYNSEYSSYSKAVLVFLPGMAEIKQLHGMLVAHSSFSQGWLVYALHSAIASDDQQKAFQVPQSGFRKIVLATNIAETGITIPDITAVIDTCKHKEMRFDERRQLSRLVQSFISRANAKQRRGRAGRVQEGLCFHLVTKYRYDNLMAEQQTPEILRLSLQDLVMRVKICGLGDIERTLSDALDPPASKNIRRAIDALTEVGALGANETLTPLGVQLAKLPLDAILGKLILLAAIFGCLDVALTVAAILSSKSPFLEPVSGRQGADAARMAFKRADSDILTVYNAYSAWRRVCNTPGLSEHEFCRKNFLSPQNLGAVEDLKAQLLSSLTEAGFVLKTDQDRSSNSRSRFSSRQRSFVTIPAAYNVNNDNDALVTTVIAWAFYPKLLVREGKSWRNVSSSRTVGLPPTSVLKAGNSAKYLSYHHIMQASNKYYNAHFTSAVQELPLLLLAGDADFRMYAGVIILDGNRLRFAVKDWKTMLALKTLRLRTEEIVSKVLKAPNKPLGDRLERWRDIILKMFMREEDSAVEKR